jgi:hypothetical protein
MLAAFGQLPAVFIGIHSLIYLARLISEIIARGDKPRAFSAFILAESAVPMTWS